MATKRLCGITCFQLKAGFFMLKNITRISFYEHKPFKE
ncbi:hypothetical protein CHCC14814_2658 [Bacillus paralicheniformis]|nr:hypothetical protein CHCC14814_2658 [Bacillus paralicheniformis]